MTPFQRKVLAQYLMNKASQLKCGLACNYHEDGRYEELTWEEMMDGKNHPKTEE